MPPSTLINLKSIKGIGPKRYEKTLNLLDAKKMTLGDLVQLSSQQIKAQFGLPIDVAKRIAALGVEAKPPVAIEFPEKPSPKVRNTSSAVTRDVQILTLDEPAYPAKLKAVLGDKAPPALYVWGNIALFNRPGIGFCGSRNVTPKGLAVTADASEQIAARAWVVVSGHARGVDSTAHRVALENNAGTIVVAPQGLDTFKLRQELKRVAKPENILIVSEFDPTAGWTVGRAMQRNRTILGLSDAMILIESRLEGGTFNAGKEALRLGRPLYVANFSETHEANAGNQYFIDRGATKLSKKVNTQRANLTPMFERVEASRPSTMYANKTPAKLHVEEQKPL